jgi:hypothetical protein
MSFFKNIFVKKDTPIQSYDDFWKWFQKNEKDFFKVVKTHKNVEEGFFDKISPKLNELKDDYFYVTGMHDENTAELVMTADGVIKNIVFVEELVASAPKIEGWMFTALKAPLDVANVSISMGDYEFNKENLHFYSNDNEEYPDEINVTVVHDDLTEENNKTVVNGTYIFLDNFLGELNFATTIDNIDIIGKKEAQKELVPIEKLKDFLIWREKEFVEKYEGVRHNTDEDSYSNYEAELESGNMLLATMNESLLDWNSKASHPWILVVEIKYEGQNGMPDSDTYELLNNIENEILEELKDYDGYLNIGRQLADDVREIYFGCKDFRKPSKVLHKIKNEYIKTIEIDYHIYKDKYWRSFQKFGKSY